MGKEELLRSYLLDSRNGGQGIADVYRRSYDEEDHTDSILFATMHADRPTNVPIVRLFDPAFLTELGANRHVFIEGEEEGGKHGYYIDADGSCYKVVTHDERTRSQDSAEYNNFIGRVDLANLVIPFQGDITTLSVAVRDYSVDFERRLAGTNIVQQDFPLGRVTTIRVSAKV